MPSIFFKLLAFFISLIDETPPEIITGQFEISATFEISGPENPLLINAVNTTNVSCNGLNDGTANLNNQITGGTPPYVNVDWGGYNPNLLNAGEYNVEVTDDNGCKSASSYIIFEPDAVLTNE